MFAVSSVQFSTSNDSLKRSANVLVECESPKSVWKNSKKSRDVIAVCKPSFMTCKGEGIVCSSSCLRILRSEATASAAIIIFIDNPNYCLGYLKELSDHIWNRFGMHFVLVCKEQYVKEDAQILFVCDPQDNLARTLGCLDPLGGGKGFINSIHILDSSNRRRLFLPIGYVTQTAYRAVSVGDLQQICDDCLAWLNYENGI